MAELRIAKTTELSSREHDAIRQLLLAAFDGDFSEADWEHALGGWHALVGSAERLMAHAAVVPRRLFIAGRPFAAGYVEAVAVAPHHQRRGFGRTVMAALNDLIPRHFELGALSSGEWGFYERLGWERWRGPTWVRTASGELLRSADEDDGVMVRRTEKSAGIDVAAPIACEERAGDSW